MPSKSLNEIAKKFTKGLTVSCTSKISGKFAPKDIVPFDPNNATVSGGIITAYSDSTLSEAIIPDSINGETIIGLGTDLFNNFTNLTSITIPPTVVSIGDTCFKNCNMLSYFSIDESSSSSSLQSIGDNCFESAGFSSFILPSSVQTIGKMLFLNSGILTSVDFSYSQISTLSEATFQGCYNLASVSLPTSLRIIDSMCFYQCAFSSITIPEGVTTMNNNCFILCNNLYSITLPSTLEYIGENCFNGLPLLNSVDLSVTNVKILGQSAFANCSGLTVISFPTTLTDISNNCFEQSGITDLTIPENSNGNLQIGESAFLKCASLSNVSLPVNLISLGKSCFQDCTGLININLSGTTALTVLEDYLFYGCLSLTNVTLPINLTEIKLGAFKNCAQLANMSFPTSLTTIGDDVFMYCYGNANFNEIDLHSTVVTSIGNQSFYDCNNINLITLPATILTIGDGTFQNIDGLTTVDLTLCTFLTSIGNSAFQDCPYLSNISFSNCTSLTTIGDNCFQSTGITSLDLTTTSLSGINTGAFAQCSQLQNIVLGPTLTTIDASGFAYCGFLTSVDFSLCNLLTNIGDRAFLNAQLTTLNLSSTAIETIGERAFSYCNSLQTVVLRSSLLSIGDYCFELTDSLTSIDFNNATSLTTLGTGAFYVSGLTNVDLTNTPITIFGTSIFQDCHDLSSIILPANLVETGQNTFFNCTSLTSITFPNIFQTMGQGTFKQCNALTSLDLTNTQLYSIGFDAFVGCSSLQSLYLPTTLATLDGNCFANSGLTSIDLSLTAITDITSNNFYNCVYLQTLVLPANLTTISDSAFYGCASLQNFTVPNSLEFVKENSFKYCTSLTSLDFSLTAVTTIFSSAFADCTSLTTFIFPNICQTISYNAFDSAGLTFVDLTNTTVQVIDSYAFNQCNDLSGFLASSNLQQINGHAFESCDKLVTVDLSNASLQLIGDYAFTSCIVLNNIILPTTPRPLAAIGIASFFNCTSLTSISIPEGFVSLGQDCFSTCSSLVNVTLPSSLETIGVSCFAACNSLQTLDLSTTAIIILPDSCFWTCPVLSSVSLPNNLATIGNFSFVNCISLSSINLPSTIISFSTGCFSGTGLTTIDLSVVNVTNFDSANAMFQNSHLQTIIFNSATTIIGSTMFAGCINLQNIDFSLIPNLTTIRTSAFEGCTSFTEINLTGNSSLQSIESYCFKDCINLTSFILPTNSGKLQLGVGFLLNTNLNNVDSIIESVPSLSDGMFQGMNITSVVIPDKFSTIPSSLFLNCTNLVSVTFPNTITGVLGNSSFNGCTNLQNIDFGNTTISYLGDSCFSGCVNLRSITFPDSVTTFGNSAFYNCSNLNFNAKSFTNLFPPNLTSIGSNAFSGSGLTIVNLTNTLVSTIDVNAFANCIKLKYVYLPTTLTSLGLGSFVGSTALEVVVFYGTNVFGSTIANGYFNSGSSKLKIYYGAGASGWIPQVTIDGYKVTLYSGSSPNGFGDPHIVTYNGIRYDLPNFVADFLLYENKEDDIRVTGFATKLPFLTLKKNKIKDKIKDATFFNTITIVYKGEKITINMKTLGISGTLPNSKFTEIYEETKYFKKSYDRNKIKKHNLSLDALVRGLNIGTYSIKFAVEKDSFEVINEIYMTGPNMKYGYGAFVSKDHKSLIKRY